MQSESIAAPFLDFQPTKEAASDILCALVDPDQTLAEIAKRFHTTLDALADWLDSPPVRERIEKMKRVAANRDELILAAHLRTALAVLLSILDGHQHDEQHIPVDPQNLKAVTQRDRRRATARLAASQLIRLAGPGDPNGPGGTDVSSVHSARRSSDRQPPTERTDRSPQAGRLCHTDHQAIRPPDPDSSSAHPLTSTPPPALDLTTHNIETPSTSLSPTPEPSTQPFTGGQAASATQVTLRAPLYDPGFQHAACAFEAG